MGTNTGTSQSEYLSSLLDDETGTFEQRRLLDALPDDTELASKMSRYALIGEAMRSQRAQAAKPGFLQGIQAAIADDAAYDAADKPSKPAEPVVEKSAKVREAANDQSWWKYGMAAAVGALSVGVVMLVQQPQQTATEMQFAMPDTQKTTVAAADAVSDVASAPARPQAAPVMSAAGTTAAPYQHVARLDAETRDILKQYVAQHFKYASTNTIVPSVRAVSYEQGY